MMAITSKARSHLSASGNDYQCAVSVAVPRMACGEEIFASLIVLFF